MAIARKPNSKPKSPMDEAAADAFIAGAAKPKAEPIATEADEAGQGAEPRKSPVMLRFDRALLAQVDAAAKRRGISPSAWIPFTVSSAPDAGEGYGRLGRGGPGARKVSFGVGVHLWTACPRTTPRPGLSGISPHSLAQR